MAERGFGHRRAAKARALACSGPLPRQLAGLLARLLAGLLIVLLLAAACLSGCAGQRLEVRPRGDVVFGVGAGSR